MKIHPVTTAIKFNFSEVMDGIEPTFKVLQTFASPLGYMTGTGCNDTGNIVVYKISRLI
jgi:hypothetical protein